MLDLRGKEIHSLNFKKTTTHELRNGDLIVQINRVSDNWKRSLSTWIYIKDGKANEFELILNLYSADEIHKLLKDIGFNQVEIYGNLKGIKYDEFAERLVVVANK